MQSQRHGEPAAARCRGRPLRSRCSASDHELVHPPTSSPPSKPTPAVRPAFVWALVLVAFPILVLFSVGMVIDDEIEASNRLVMAPIYLLCAWVAPVVLWRRLVRRGTPPSDAVAAALALAVVALALDLTLLAGAGSGGIFWLAQIGRVVTILVLDRSKRRPV
jgi:hypothetical protein